MISSKDVKRIPIGKWAAIIGAVAGLIAAATPGYIEWLDKTEDVAKENAVESKELTNLAWDMVRQELSFIKEQIQDLKDRDKAKSELLIKMLMEQAKMSDRRSRTVRRRSASRGPSSASGDSLGGLGPGGAVKEAEVLLEGVKEHKQMVQQTLPVDLEEALAYEKAKDSWGEDVVAKGKAK
jgi:hypothetical protein